MLDPEVQVVRVEPSIGARLAAERQLSSLCGAGDTLLCFGNLPPLWPSRASVFVYLQNRYLTSPRLLNGLSWRAWGRLQLERLWLRSCLRDAKILVQTESMASEVRQHLGRNCQVLPFAPASTLSPPTRMDAPPDEMTGTVRHPQYVYVASGEPHKNHRRLLEAWRLLAMQDCFPTLRLTLHPQRDAELWGWIGQQVRLHSLKIHSEPVAPEDIPALYAQSSALIYPSLFESFGLPLLEARAAGLEILASERDFVRDVVSPSETFDPESALSIARAVLRHRHRPQAPRPPLDPAEFLRSLAALI